MPNGTKVPDSVWFYDPSEISAGIFTGLFFISGLVHLWQCIHFKAFKITGLHPFACVLFVGGFALRTYGAIHYDNLTILIISSICIYGAPPILELANYHVLGRILFYVPYHAPLHPGRTLTTFGTLSFFVEICSGIGIAQITNTNLSQKRQDIGHILMKAALIMQVLIMMAFIAIAIIFHRRCRRAGIRNKKVTEPLLTLYVSTVYIMIRTVYRIVEHFGYSGIPKEKPDNWDPSTLSPMIRYEWFFYVFEASMMLSNSIFWNARHPRFYLPEDYHVYLAQDGISELVGPGWKTDQSWIMSFIDPCGLLGRKNKPREKPFWEDNGYGDSAPLVKKGDGQEV